MIQSQARTSEDDLGQRINDVAPGFTVKATEGSINFQEWIGEHVLKLGVLLVEGAGMKSGKALTISPMGHFLPSSGSPEDVRS